MAATEVGPGAVLGDRWRLRHQLGSGGMATVWLAEDARLEREVAVKVVSPELTGDPALGHRFTREARVAAGLTHPNLVRVYDFSPGPPRPYLVMEYVPGGTLADRLRDRAPLDAEALAAELLAALGHVHGAGIVHRDVKPANVLIDPSGHAHLTDFGIARPSEATQLTSTGLVVGTRRYIAPEVLAGAPADARADLFALGMLLSECLEVVTGPRRLVSLSRRLAAPDPTARPASAEAALAELRSERGPATPATGATAVLSRRPVRPDPRPRPQLTLEPGIRFTRPAAIALAALLAVAVLVVSAIALSAGAGPARPAAGAQRLVVPAPGAPLSAQLAALRRDVRSLP